jgi:rhodanese-related sulfurtransferase
MPTPSTIRPSELQKLLVSSPEAAVVDVRTPAEFAEVRVPQARNLPLGSLDIAGLEKAGIVSKEAALYILCQSGKRATTAAEKFASAGFTRVFVVEGGTLAWAEAGLPVVRSGGKAISIERQVRIGAGSLVLTGVLLGFFVNAAFFGISAFVGAGLIFAGITDWCGMGLLLAKAPWNR